MAYPCESNVLDNKVPGATGQYFSNFRWLFSCRMLEMASGSEGQRPHVSSQNMWNIDLIQICKTGHVKGRSHIRERW
jgi:hypothetical protein